MIDPKIRSMRIVDNGKGMNDREFEEYHDIAATTKTRGKGIGFAGVGVKLSLLCAKSEGVKKLDFITVSNISDKTQSA